MMGRSRELCQQLLEQPFNEVKARMVRFALWMVNLRD